MYISCPSFRDTNREYPQTQRPRRCEHIPVGLLAIIRLLARCTSGDSHLIVFGPEGKR
jgi:hypothetical protein